MGVEEKNKKLRKQTEQKKEFDLRCRELKLREQEIERQKCKDADDKKRRETLAAQTWFYGDAMKHALLSTIVCAAAALTVFRNLKQPDYTPNFELLFGPVVPVVYTYCT